MARMSPTDGTIRVFLMDDHEIVRRGLADLIGLERDMEVVGEAGSTADALHRIPPCRPGLLAEPQQTRRARRGDPCRGRLSQTRLRPISGRSAGFP